MFLDKFRDKYSFNLLVSSGLFSLLISCLFFLFILFNLHSGISSLIVTFLILELAFIQLIVSILSYIIYIIEEIFNKKIKNNLFLKSKVISNLQLVGIINYLLVFILALIIILSLIIFRKIS